MNAFDDDAAVLDMLSNYATDDFNANSSGNQEFKSNYYPHTPEPIGNISTNPQLQKQHILSTGTAFVTEVPPVMIPQHQQQSPPIGAAGLPFGTNFPYTDSDMSRDMHVVKSSSSKSHKKQKTFFDNNQAIISATSPTAMLGHHPTTIPRSSEYFIGDIPSSSTASFPPKPFKHPLTQLPITLFQAFNAGDITKVKEIVTENTIPTCSLRTPSLDSDVIGRQYVQNFFQAIYDAHPDAVFVTKKCKYNPLQHSIDARIYFAGTRMMKSSLLLSEIQSNNDWLAGVGSFLNSEYLYKKKAASLLDEMDVSMLSHAEIAAMKELENSGKNLSVFFKGSLVMFLTVEGTKIQKFAFDWRITSFREANL